MLSGSLVTSVACPQVADGGEALQMWSITANLLIKQLWTANKEYNSTYTKYQSQKHVLT
jgi:hypothetical protein